MDSRDQDQKSKWPSNENDSGSDEEKNAEQLLTMRPQRSDAKSERSTERQELGDQPERFMVYPRKDKIMESPFFSEPQKLSSELQKIYDSLFESNDPEVQIKRQTFETEQKARVYPLDPLKRQANEREIVVLKGGSVVGFIDSNGERVNLPVVEVARKESKKEKTDLKEYKDPFEDFVREVRRSKNQLATVTSHLEEIGKMEYAQLSTLVEMKPASNDPEQLQKQLRIARKEAALAYVERMPSFKTSKEFDSLMDEIRGAKDHENQNRFSYMRRHTGGWGKLFDYGDTDTWQNILKNLDEKKRPVAWQESQERGKVHVTKMTKNDQ